MTANEDSRYSPLIPKQPFYGRREQAIGLI